MVLEALANLLGDKEPKPNKFTIAMGELIRKAREEAGLSQNELAEYIYRRRATVTDIESGKHEPDTSSLVLIAAALNKPITYFIPKFIRRDIKPDELNAEEQEMLLVFRDIWDEYLQRVAINQIKALAEFNPKQTLLDAIDITKNEVEIENEVKEFIKRRKRK